VSTPHRPRARPHPRRNFALAAGAAAPGLAPPKGDEVFKYDRQQDDASVRAKNSGHGKKTADKWNQ
jgi:hypothetical protein